MHELMLEIPRKLSILNILRNTMKHRIYIKIISHLVTYLGNPLKIRNFPQFFSKFREKVQFYLFFNRSYVTRCAVMRHIALLNSKMELVFLKALFFEELRFSSLLVGLVASGAVHVWEEMPSFVSFIRPAFFKLKLIGQQKNDMKHQCCFRCFCPCCDKQPLLLVGWAQSKSEETE